MTLGPERQLKSAQEFAVVSAALEELPQKCREAFVMNRFDNMNFIEIAAELNLSVSMIEKHVSRAIAHMRKRLKESQEPREPVTQRRDWVTLK